MNRIIFIIRKKPIKDKQRSLDRALFYFKDNLELSFNRWLMGNGSSVRIGRTSYQRIIIPAIEDINLAVSRYIPEFKVFELIQTSWRKDKYHKSIKRNQGVSIQEDKRHFYIEVLIPKHAAG